MGNSVPVPLPTARSGIFDPPSELGRLREEGPIHRLLYPDGHVGWLVTSYALARTVLADRRLSKDASQQRAVECPVGDLGHGLSAEHDRILSTLEAGNFIDMDPPDHTRFRRLLAGRFTMRETKRRLQSHIEQTVEELLDAMQEMGAPTDLVDNFAAKVSLRSLCEMLGIPQSEHETIGRMAATFNLLRSDESSSSHDVRQRSARVDDLHDLIRQLIRLKLKAPGDDLLSHLAAADELTEDERVGVGMTLALVGVHTNSTMLAHGGLLLLQDRRRWVALSTDDISMDGVVEELLRYLTIPQVDAHTRTALEDVNIGGVLIKAGERVHVSLPAANRDPDRWDAADVFDTSRDSRGHLTFGHGVHQCIGQHLSRLELRIGFGGLVRRFPTLRLAVPVEDVEMASGSAVLYGPHHLPVAW